MVIEANRTEMLLTPQSRLGPYRQADYQALGEGFRGELLYGRILVSPSPTFEHQAIISCLHTALRAMASRARGTVCLAPLDVELAGHSTVQPDLIYVASDRRHIIGTRIVGAPSLVIEVTSPSTARQDRGEKLKLYAESEIPEYWIVDGDVRSMTFLVLRGRAYQVALASDDRYRSERLPEIDLDLKAFWSDVARELDPTP